MTGKFSESGRRPHTNVAFHVASSSRSGPILLKINLKLPLMLLAVCTKVMGIVFAVTMDSVVVLSWQERPVRGFLQQGYKQPRCFDT